MAIPSGKSLLERSIATRSQELRAKMEELDKIRKEVDDITTIINSIKIALSEMERIERLDRAEIREKAMDT